VDARDAATKRDPGRPKKEVSEESVSNIHNSSERPSGTTQAAALRRLRDQRPDLHRKVLAKEISANAAAIEAELKL
jgi:hypothetical protein